MDNSDNDRTITLPLAHAHRVKILLEFSWSVGGPHFTYGPRESRSNTRLPRAMKDAKCNSSLVPRSNTMVTVAPVCVIAMQYRIAGNFHWCKFFVYLTKTSQNKFSCFDFVC